MKNKLTKLILIYITIISCYNNANSQKITCLAVSDTNIFAGTDLGVFRISNSGDTWTLLNKGMENQGVTSLAVAGENMIAFYQHHGAGVNYADAKMYISNNHGENWITINPIKTWIESVAINGKEIFVGSTEVNVTTDNGSNWTKLMKSIKMSSKYVSKPLFSIFTNKTNIYAVSESSGVFLSSDKGKNWKKIKAYPQNKWETGDPRAVVASALSGSTLLINSGVTVLKSVDGGDFSKVFEVEYKKPEGNEWAYNITSLAINESTMLVGTHRALNISTDNGVTWTTVKDKKLVKDRGLLKVSSLAICGQSLYALCDDTLYLSTNKGADWFRADKGLYEINNEKKQQENENALKNGKFEWWNSYEIKCEKSDKDINCFARNGDNIFLGTSACGLFYSTNRGLNFVEANFGIPTPINGVEVRSLTISGNNIFAATSEGLFLSNNNGETWSALECQGFNNKLVKSLAINDNTIFASSNQGVFLSTNNGTNWLSTNNVFYDSVVYALVIKDNKIFASTKSGLFLSTDNGQSWKAHGTNNAQRLAEGLKKIVFSSMAFSGDTLVAGTYYDGYCSSNDGGLTWGDLRIWESPKLLHSSKEGLDVGLSAYFVKKQALVRGEKNEIKNSQEDQRRMREIDAEIYKEWEAKIPFEEYKKGGVCKCYGRGWVWGTETRHYKAGEKLTYHSITSIVIKDFDKTDFHKFKCPFCDSPWKQEH